MTTVVEDAPVSLQINWDNESVIRRLSAIYRRRCDEKSVSCTDVSCRLLGFLAGTIEAVKAEPAKSPDCWITYALYGISADAVCYEEARDIFLEEMSSAFEELEAELFDDFLQELSA